MRDEEGIRFSEIKCIETLFKFIRIENISLDEFETITGIQIGTLNDVYTGAQKLTAEIMDKITSVYTKRLNDTGFGVFDAEGFELPFNTIIDLEHKESENPHPEGTDEWSNWHIAHYLKGHKS